MPWRLLLFLAQAVPAVADVLSAALGTGLYVHWKRHYIWPAES